MGYFINIFHDIVSFLMTHAVDCSSVINNAEHTTTKFNVSAKFDVH